MLVFTNLDLFSSRFLENFSSEVKQTLHLSKDDVYQDQEIKTNVLQETGFQTEESLSGEDSQSMEDLLKSKLSDYDFNFNTLPPVNKLVIPSIALDVSIVDSKFKEIKDFTN